jgi:hypothetical protein
VDGRALHSEFEADAGQDAGTQLSARGGGAKGALERQDQAARPAHPYLSALAREPVAIVKSEDGLWTVRFYHHSLGVIDEQHAKLRRPGLPLKMQAGPSLTSEL